MTQAAVNNAIVLYRLAVERRDVEEAQRVYFVTEKLAQTLANPLIPLTKKYDIIEKVYGFESEPKLITSFIKEMVKLGYAAEMNEIFEAYYRYWDEKNHIIRAELISAEAATDEEAKDAYFFVTDLKGSYYYARTLSEHNANCQTAAEVNKTVK